LAAAAPTFAPSVKNNMKNLILLPAFSKDKHSYGTFIKLASDKWNVIVPSYKKLRLHKGVNVFEQNLLSYIKSFGRSKIYLLGHSLGGALAIGFTANYPELIKRLFLADSKGIHNPSLYSDAFVFFFRNRKRSFLQRIKHILFLLKSPLFHFKSAMIAHKASLEQKLKEIQTETMIFWGENDVLTPLEHGKKMQKLIPNSKLIVFKNLGHDWILDDPQKFWDKIN